MSTHPRIEELPDDFDESLNLNAPPRSTEPEPQQQVELPVPGNEERLRELEKESSAPKMPPAMAAVESHTTDELADILNKTPLFMTDISKAGDEREFSCGQRN
jgi:hypothetical protein